MYKIPHKTTVLEELEYWNVLLVIKRLNKYFNSIHGYDRGLRGLSAEDFSMTVLTKIISGERSWEKSSKTSFIHFCFDVMKSELTNYRNSCDYRLVESSAFNEDEYIRGDYYERAGLDDKFNGF